MISQLLAANLSAGILSSIGSIGLALLVLLFMITVHEFGHYIVAKAFDFKVNEFAIGMGPAILKKTKKNGEIFSIRVLPLGGFCAFEGEDEDASDPRAFNNRKPWQRILVLIAGASMNFIAAVIIFCISIGCYGQMCMQAFEVAPTTPDSAYSLQNEDIILTLNGKDLYLTADLTTALKGKKAGDIVDATVIRKGETKPIQIQIKLRTTPVAESMQDYENVLESLGIATLAAVTESQTSVKNAFNTGDYLLRIDSNLPTFYDQSASGLTDCMIVDGNGEYLTKYIDEATYLNTARAFTPEDFVSLLKEYNSGDTVYFYLSRTAGRVMLEYKLPDNFDQIKQNDQDILSYFNIKLETAGYRMYSQNVKFGFFESIERGIVYAFKNVSSTLSAFWQLLTGKLGLDALGGPVSTITITSQYASMGLNYLLEIAGFIGISLAVFNLLPIPALDGARVIFVLIEWIRKKPVNRNVEGAIHAVGLVLLLVFAVVVDLVKCI